MKNRTHTKKMNIKKRVLVFLISFVAVVPALKAQAYTITPLGTSSLQDCLPSDYSPVNGWIGGCEVVGSTLSAFATKDSPISISTPTFLAVSFPDYFSSKGFSINSSGVTVGFETNTLDQNQAFYWDIPYTSKALPLPSGGSVSEAYGINDSASIVGSVGTVAAQWDPPYTTSSSLGTLGGTTSVAYDINNYGTVVGQSKTSSGINHAFLKVSGSSMIDIHPFTGASSSEAGAVSSTYGEAVGTAYYSNGNADGFFRFIKPVQYANITTSCGSACQKTWAYNVNNNYLVVGRFTNSSGNYRAFLYNAFTDVFTDLNTLLPSGSTWVLEAASGIDDSNKIVGIGRRSGGALESFLMTP